MDQVDICKVGSWSATVSQLTEISEPKDWVTPPGCLGCIGIELPRPPSERNCESLISLHVTMMYCKLQMLFTIVYCSEPTKRIQAILGYSLPKTLSPGVASGILVTSCSLAALITQATATASLSCRNASCGFRSVAEPLDWEIKRRLWGVLGIFTAQLTFQKQGAWSCHHKSYKSVRACKCN